MDYKYDVSVIIVSWRVKELLRSCLASVFKQTNNIKIEVIVIDNASDDGTLEMVTQEYPQVHLIVNNNNAGFAKANNQGIRKSNGNYILLLNPDTEITDSAIEKTFEFMKNQKDAGIAGCRIYYPNGSDQKSVRRFPTVGSMSLVLLKLHHVIKFSNVLREYFGEYIDYSKTQAVDQVMGAYFFIRSEVIEKIGLLDEGFYIWFEEVDFCYRASREGWKTYYHSESKIIHHHGQSFKQVLSFNKQRIFNKSLMRYARKHFSTIGYWLIAFLTIPSLVISFIIQLFRR